MALAPVVKQLGKAVSSDPALPKSLMSEVINTLPDDWVMKSDSIPNYLVKRGIKPEELTTSGLHEKLAAGGSKRLNKLHMQSLDVDRADVISRTKTDANLSTMEGSTQAIETGSSEITTDLVPASHQSVTATVDQTAKHLNYSEDIIGFTRQGESRRVQSHYPEVPDYLMHARTTTGPVGGKQTRVVQELQSDLFQQRRKKGIKQGVADNLTTRRKALMTEIDSLTTKRNATINRGEMFNDKDRQRLADLNHQSHALMKDIRMAQSLPDAPFEKNWLNKNLDYQLFQAGSEGQEALAIPLEGFSSELARSEGVQKWYETQIRSTMKKRVKSLNNLIKRKNPKATEDELFSYKELIDTDTSWPKGTWPRSTTIEGLDKEYTNYLKEFNLPAIEIDELIAETPTRYLEDLATFKERYKIIKEGGKPSDKVTGQIVFPTRGVIKNPMIVRQISPGVTETKLGQPDWLDQIKLYTPAGAAITAGTLVSGEDAEAGPVIQTISSLAKQTARSSTADQLTADRSIASQPRGITTVEERATQANSSLVLKIDKALMQGAPPKELAQVIADSEGVSITQATGYVDQALSSKVLAVLDDNNGPMAQELAEFLRDEQGLDADQIKRIFPANDILNRYWKGVGEVAVDTFAAMNAPKTPEQIVSRAKNTNFKYKDITKQMGGIFSDELKQDAAEDAYAQGLYIQHVLKENGIVSQVDEEGEIYYQNAKGEMKLAETAFVDEIFAGRSELAYALAGGISGAAATPGPWWAKAIGGTAASAVGAAYGRGEDVVRNALQTKQDIEQHLVYEKMLDAGMADITLGVLGAGAAKLVKSSAKGIYNVLDTMMGNKEGAYIALKDAIPGLDDDAAREIISEWEKFNQRKAPGRRLASKALNVIPRVKEGVEDVVAHGVGTESRAGATLALEIDKRAKDIYNVANKGSSDDIGRIIGTGLKDYERLVKDNFTSVKEIAKIATENSNYTFDYDKLALEPLRNMTARLTNKDLQEVALRTFTKIQRHGGKKVSLADTQQLGLMTPTDDVPALRSFENLLDLRREVNIFGRQKWIKSAPDIKAIRKVKDGIDKEIANAARKHMDNPDEWLAAWKKANTEYSNMADVKVNLLTKAIQKKGLSNPASLKTLMKMATAGDETFRQVLEAVGKTNPRLVPLAENSVIKGFIAKATSGRESSLQAIDFPSLADDLASVTLTSPQARALKRTIKDFASIYKNDPKLAAKTGKIKVGGISQALTTDQQKKAEFAINSGIFNWVQQFKPTQNGRTQALVRRVGEALKNPLDSRNASKIMAELGPDPEFKNQLTQQFIELGKFGVRSDFPEVKIYRTSKEGQSNVKSKGSLGKGVYYHATKESADKAKREGSKVTSQKINPKDIVDETDLKEILGVDEVTREMIRNNPGLQDKLLDQGKKGIIINNQIILFNH